MTKRTTASRWQARGNATRPRRRRPMLRQQLRWWRTVYRAPRQVVASNNARRGR